MSVGSDSRSFGSRPEAPDRASVPSWMLLAVACVGQFMVVLDISIVIVALPSMQRDLGFSTSQLQWVVNAYALTFGGFLLLGGRAADLFGRRRIFILGLALFSGASLICGLAQDQAMLIAARALQGIGGAVLAPASLTVLTTAFRETHERARALGIWSAMAAIGGASGALFGGILTDLLSWRWIFYINLPIGFAAIVAARYVLSESRAEGDRPGLDFLGSFTATGALLALVYALSEAAVHPWTTASTLVPLGVAVSGLTAFVFVEMRVARAPLVPFRLFRSRALVASNISMFLIGGAMFGMWLFLSLYLQDVLHFSPLTTGISFLPQTAAIAIASQISARLVPRLGPRPLIVAGVLLSAIGLLWLSQVTPTGTYLSGVLGGSVFTTFGMGIAFTPLAFAATAGVAPQEAGLASGVLNTSRQVGGAIGLAVFATIAADRTRALLAGFPHTRAREAMALTSGFSRVFWVAMGILVVGALAALVIPSIPRATQADATVDRAELDEAADTELGPLAVEVEG